MAENQIQTLKDKLEVSNVYALERENLNKNLLRIMKERANADREIVPKKKHHGYIIFAGVICKAGSIQIQYL